MADFTKQTHGAGATRNVDLVISVYDNNHWSKDTDREGKPLVNKQGQPYTREGVFVQQTVHPESRIAEGQTYLGLKSVDNPNGGRKLVNENLSKGQFEKVVEAAGANVSDLKNKEGEVVGKNYGVQANVFFKGEGRNRYALLDSNSLQPSELSVAEVDGKTIQDRIFESQAAAKAAKETAKQAPQAEAAEAEAPQVDAVEAQNDEPELG